MMDVRRLRLLVELSRLGTMSAVAEATGYGTSAVSQQLGALERECRTVLLERDGRRVRLTPAAHRLVSHAAAVLDILETAQGELGGDRPPAGLLRVAGFASGMRPWVLPVIHGLVETHPDLQVRLEEREPEEVIKLLAEDQLDVGLVYDYNLYQRFQGSHTTHLVAHEPMALAVPSASGMSGVLSIPGELLQFADMDWITNSRGSDDDELALRLCGMAGFRPTLSHRADSLELVEDFVAAGLGVALLPRPAGRKDHPDVNYLPIAFSAERRIFTLTSRARAAWPPVALLHKRLTGRMRASSARWAV